MRAVVYHNYGETDNLTLTTWPDPVAGRGQVLINGAGGGSGPLAIQLAKAAGADVTAVDTAEKASFMTDRGADRTIDYLNTDFACEDARYDLIVDPVGTRPMRRIDLVLALGSHYRLIGGTTRAMFLALIMGGARGGR